MIKGEKEWERDRRRKEDKREGRSEEKNGGRKRGRRGKQGALGLLIAAVVRREEEKRGETQKRERGLGERREVTRERGVGWREGKRGRKGKGRETTPIVVLAGGCLTGKNGENEGEGEENGWAAVGAERGRKRG
ncbi:uncharacterized protein [Solanum lycopersicum]|uniref:uncharacterized protein n=1 Tax=Solanum lycopersicum TaxID=4081 RepID=UPI003748C8A5